MSDRADELRLELLRSGMPNAITDPGAATQWMLKAWDALDLPELAARTLSENQPAPTYDEMVAARDTLSLRIAELELLDSFGNQPINDAADRRDLGIYLSLPQFDVNKVSHGLPVGVKVTQQQLLGIAVAEILKRLTPETLVAVADRLKASGIRITVEP